MSNLARPSPRRGPVRRVLETRGLLGGLDPAALTTRIRTDDGVLLEGSYLPGPPRAPLALVLVHGFAAHRAKPAYSRLAAGLARVAPVLTLDLRGHGGSGGRCTLGDTEVADIAAGVRWLTAHGHPQVAAVGASMGATAVLHAAARGVPLAGVVTVSAPAWFRDPPETAAMQRLDRLWRSPVQRWALRVLLGVTLEGPRTWGGLDHPVVLAGSVTVPWLVVHGVDDAYFPVDDARALVAAAGRSDAHRAAHRGVHRAAHRAARRAVLWAEPDGFGHAEDGFTPGFIDRLAQAVDDLGRLGRFPPHQTQPIT